MGDGFGKGTGEWQKANQEMEGSGKWAWEHLKVYNERKEINHFACKGLPTALKLSAEELLIKRIRMVEYALLLSRSFFVFADEDGLSRAELLIFCFS